MKYKRLLTLVLCLACIFSLSIPVFAADKNSAENFTITSTKELHDFAGNSYTVLEYAPTGYYIYENCTGQFVEYSTTAISPYHGFDGELLYIGPSEYYYISNDKIYSTLSNAPLTNISDVGVLKQKSVQLGRALESQKIDSQAMPYQNQQSDPLKSTLAASKYSYIPNASFFRNSTHDFGYYCPAGSNGVCGYIAANLVLQFWDYCGDIVLGSEYTSASNLRNATLSKKLRTYGTSDDTTAVSMRKVVNSFCSDEDLNLTASWFALGAGHLTYLDNGIPVICFGIFDGKAHAVVYYGVVRDQANEVTGYIAHFGYEGRSEVTVNVGLVGTILVIE